MHAWKVGDEVWARYYDMATNGYVAELEGHVTHVGPKGFTMRRTRPNHRGQIVFHRPHDVGMWPTREAAEAYLAAHPFNTGRVERE